MNCSWKFSGGSFRKVLIGIRVNVQEVICGWQFVVFDQFAADCDGEVQHELLGILNNGYRYTNMYISVYCYKKEDKLKMTVNAGTLEL